MLRAALLVLAPIALGAASPAQAQLLHDIANQPLGTAPSGADEMVELGSLVICTTRVGNQSIGVFAIDPVAGTATLLTSASAPPTELTRVGNLACWASGGAVGVTDGTVAGTRYRTVSLSEVRELTPVSSTLAFVYEEQAGGRARIGFLHTSTGRVTRFDRAVDPSDPERLAATSSAILFTAVGSSGAGRELWEVDSVGTRLNYEFSPGAASTEFGPVVAAEGLRYVLVAATPAGGSPQLYVASRSGGLPGYRPIPVGTLAAREIQPLPGTSTMLIAGVDPSASIGEELYLFRGPPSYAPSLQLVADIAPGQASSSPSFASAVGGRGFFSADDGTHGRELWSSDGAPSGTGLVADIRVGPGSGLTAGGVSAADVTLGGARLLAFVADDGTSGGEPWISDGTPNGTRLLLDAYPGPAGSEPQAFVDLAGSAALFAATDRLLGTEPWITDGTGAATRVLVDLDPTPGGPVTGDSDPANGVRYGDHVLFAADDGLRGVELWRTVGAGGAQLVADLRVGASGSSPRELTVVGDLLFFTAANDAGTRRLWVQRGALSRPRVVSGTTFDPSELCAVGDLLFFKNQDPATGAELWKSDGTSAGTMLVRNLVPGSGSSDPHGIVEFRGRAYFVATHPNFGTELWTSDGTAASTLFVRDIVQGAGSSSPRDLTVVGDTLLFTATSSGAGRELWKSGGTTGSTVLVVDIRAGLRGSDPTELTRVGERLFFMADDGVRGREVWVSDGTAAGTRIVRDVWPGTTRGALGSLLAGGDLLYFHAMDATGGPEPWRSDGTQAGTFALGDLQLGVGGSYPDFQAASGSRFVWFSARTLDDGRELWRSDGTAAGTVRVTDILPGGDSSNPTVLGVIGTRLVFAADDPLKGREPFVLDVGATAVAYGYGCSFGRQRPVLQVEDLVIGGFASATLTGVRSGAFAFYALSASPLQQPSRLSAPGCWLYPDAASIALWGPFTPAGGRFQLPLAVPNLPALAGRELVWQGLAAPTPAPIGFDSSGAVLATFGS